MGRGLRRLLTGCLMAMVLLCVCGVLASQVAGNFFQDIFSFLNTVVEVPYAVDQRPLPSSPFADVLLPATAGPYARVSSDPSGGGLTGWYDVMGAQVRVRAAQYPSAGQAQAQINPIVTQTEGQSRLHVYRTGTDPSYIRAVLQDGTARFAWSRGPYFFDVLAANEATLDVFMASFPY